MSPIMGCVGVCFVNGILPHCTEMNIVEKVEFTLYYDQVKNLVIMIEHTF